MCMYVCMYQTMVFFFWLAAATLLLRLLAGFIWITGGSRISWLSLTNCHLFRFKIRSATQATRNEDIQIIRWGHDVYKTLHSKHVISPDVKRWRDSLNMFQLRCTSEDTPRIHPPRTWNQKKLPDQTPIIRSNLWGPRRVIFSTSAPPQQLLENGLVKRSASWVASCDWRWGFARQFSISQYESPKKNLRAPSKRTRWPRRIQLSNKGISIFPETTGWPPDGIGVYNQHIFIGMCRTSNGDRMGSWQPSFGVNAPNS